jgi:zona occludens toxin (predicted ATPase)
MDSEVYQQTQSGQLASAMEQYKLVNEGYVRLVRLALNAEPSKRQEILITIENQNKRLQDIVEKILQMWNGNKAKLTEYGKYKISELKKKLEDYKRQMEELKQAQDEVVKLQILNQTIQGENKQDRTMYFGYIIASLVLLVLVFVMFVYTSFSRTSNWSFFSSSSSSSILPSSSSSSSILPSSSSSSSILPSSSDS